MKRKFFNFCIFLTLCLGFSSILFAGRPLTTEDTETVEKGKFELEIGYNLIQNNDQTKNQEIEISLKSGITEWMDLGIVLPFIIEESDTKINEWEKIEIGTKFYIFKRDEKKTGFSLKISGSPNLKEGDKSFIINSILTKQIRKATIHLNLGTYFLKREIGTDSIFTYSGAIEYVINENLNLCGEIVCENNDENPMEILIGMNYALRENLYVDMGVGFGLNNFSYDWRITGGITLKW
ncbi:MAG: hypothetical protein N2589_00735 [bacterium]|nr:hypothetical protein [bacterium]